MFDWLDTIPWLSRHALTVLMFLPLAGSMFFALPLFAPKGDPDGRRARAFALLVTLLCFLVSLGVLARFAPAGGMQFRETYKWIPSFGISYAVGVDGISLVLVMLTTMLMPIVVLAARSVTRRGRGYLAAMLVLQSAMIGALVSLDLFLFYVFWEAMLAPMYFIIGIWGGERRVHAALKFVLYTVGGSFLMLIAMFFLAWRYQQQTGEFSFLLARLMQTRLSPAEELWLFIAFATAFAIKVPLFPLHTWLPDAHVEAPTGGSVVLAAILLKMGVYGFLRFAFPLFPRAALEAAPWLAGLAVAGIVYGALVAWAQSDIKKLVAYSSVSHLGYCILGLAACTTAAVAGSVFQMISHGFTTGALFLIVGILYERRHTRQIAEYGGLAAQMPLFAFFFLVFTLGSIALPLTTGFVGEFLVLSASFPVFKTLTAISLLGVIFGAVYMLTLYMRMMYGEVDQAKNGALPDLNLRETATLLPLLVLVLLFGVYPQPILDRVAPSAALVLHEMRTRRDLLSGYPGYEPADDRQRGGVQVIPAAATEEIDRPSGGEKL